MMTSRTHDAGERATEKPLTEARVEALRPPDPTTDYRRVWDPSLKGFGVRVGRGGAKAYMLRYRTATGRQREKTLGRIEVLSFEEARRRAKRDLGLVADGQDPLTVFDEARTALTFNEVATLFLAEHVTDRCRPATARLYRLVITRHLGPALGKTPIGDVSAAQIVRLQHKLQGTPYLANRCVAVLSKLLAWAVQTGRRTPSPNPCQGIQKFKEQPRRRYLTPAEFATLGATLRKGARTKTLTPSVIAIIKLLLLTGCRSGEILGLRWAEVDLKGRKLHLAESKTGPKDVLLSDPAVKLLKTWPHVAGSPYVFPGEGRGGKGAHRVNVTDAWGWIRKNAKMPDLRVHDLRHSFASIAVSGGQSLPVIGALLGHSQPATTQRYSHLMDHPLRAASEQTAKTIATALNRRMR